MVTPNIRESSSSLLSFRPKPSLSKTPPLLAHQPRPIALLCRTTEATTWVSQTDSDEGQGVDKGLHEVEQEESHACGAVDVYPCGGYCGRGEDREGIGEGAGVCGEGVREAW